MATLPAFLDLVHQEMENSLAQLQQAEQELQRDVGPEWRNNATERKRILKKKITDIGNQLVQGNVKWQAMTQAYGPRLATGRWKFDDEPVRTPFGLKTASQVLVESFTTFGIGITKDTARNALDEAGGDSASAGRRLMQMAMQNYHGVHQNQQNQQKEQGMDIDDPGGFSL